MFPLVNRDQPNPLELFQIWLNLPRADKMVEPHFTMLWRESIPRVTVRDEAGRATEITVIAGVYNDARPLAPPPHSWAARPESDFALWSIAMAPSARWKLPAAAAGTNRTLYFFGGSALRVAGRAIAPRNGVLLRPDAEVEIENGPDGADLLLMQARPIGEPVAAHGPFVMNTRGEIEQAFNDYRRTRFGGWPWGASDPVHPRETERFARRGDGEIERPK